MTAIAKHMLVGQPCTGAAVFAANEIDRG